MPEISLATAARFGMLLRAVQVGDRLLVAEMVVSLPADEVPAIEARLRRFGVDPATMLANA
jgi:hypothetical protein